MTSFAEFIRTRKHDIMEAWRNRVRRSGQARHLTEPQLIDHIPLLLDRIGDLSDDFADGAKGHNRGPLTEPSEHARERVREGFDLAEVVNEYAALRESILELWEAADQTQTTIRPLHRALDYAIAESVRRYVELRDRTLRALDNVSSAAFASLSLDGLLTRLLRVFTDTMPAVQTCAILLREEDHLRVRASVGLEEDLANDGYVQHVGEGIAGTIAATGKSLFIASAATDPLVKSAAIRARGVRALFGVPMRGPGDEVIGVAHMGSLTAEDFSVEDKDLFESMVSRASLAIEYRLARARAERAVAIRDDILAVVSHDLRNPLSTVGLGVNLVRQSLPEDERGERVEKVLSSMQRAANRANRLVNDLLDYGAIEARSLRVSPRPESCEEIIQEIIESHAVLAQENGVHLVTDIGKKTPKVLADRERVVQALSNFVTNALKVSARGKTITLGCRAEGTSVRFSVRDEGSGIDEDVRAHIFERYFRGPKAEGRGRGLGLAIVKGIIEAHRGSVGVTSEVGKGSTFHFRIPAVS